MRVHYSSDRSHSERSEESSYFDQFGQLRRTANVRRSVSHLVSTISSSSWMFRSAQHDSASISCSFAFGLFLRSDCVFLETLRVRVGEIRRILVRLIEHFSSTTRISGVFLDQRCD